MRRILFHRNETTVADHAAIKLATLLLFIILSIAVVDRLRPEVFVNLRTVVGDIIAPIYQFVSEPLNGIKSIGDNIVSLTYIYHENKALKQEIAKLNYQIDVARHLMDENQELRQLLKLPPLNGQVGEHRRIIIAQIISLSTGGFSRSILINKGKNDGIQAGNAVTHGERLLGLVASAGESTARVTLLTDLISTIPIKIAGSKVKGILRGANNHYPQITNFEYSEDIKAGQDVHTSGIGDILPADIFIGQIKKPIAGNKLEDEILIQLAVDFKKINRVQVIKQSVDIQGIFPQ